MHGEEKDLDVVLARVNQLEDRLRRMRRGQRAALWSGGVLLMILAMLPMLLASGAAGPEKELRASRFVLVDDKGAERAELGFNSLGTASLFSGDKKSGQGVLLALDDEGAPFLSLAGKGNARVRIGFRSSGEPLMELSDGGDEKAQRRSRVGKEHGAALRLKGQRGKTRFVLAANDLGHSGVVLLDQREQARGSFVIDDEGRPSITMVDPKGNNRVVIGTEKDGNSPSISLWDKKRQASLALILFEDHSPILSITDKNGKQLLVLGIDDGSPKLLLKDKQEKTIWTAP